MKACLMIILSVVVVVSACKKSNSGNQSNKPSAKFVASGYEVAAPCTITLINVSTNATSYEWNFGDGSTSTQFNPTHTYISAGSYLLKLTVTGPEGVNSVCKLLAIEAAPLPGKSAFSYFQDKCAGTPVGISFKTINPNSTNTVWNFGTGPLVIDRDPIEQFLVPGDYTITYSSMIGSVRDTVIRIIRIE